MGLRKWITLMGAGAGLMYFYDPDHGKQRRALLSKQWTRLQRDGQQFWTRTQQDLQSRRDGMQDGQSWQGESAEDGSGLLGTWPPSARMLQGVAGGLMTFYGIARGGLLGTAATFFGLKLATRGFPEQGQQAMGGSGSDASFRNQTGRQGHVDKVGQTGVYPASDPHAPADAQAQGMASWGQGERGAAGYEDSGSSELNLGGESGGFDSMQPSNPGSTEGH